MGPTNGLLALINCGTETLTERRFTNRLHFLSQPYCRSLTRQLRIHWHLKKILGIPHILLKLIYKRVAPHLELRKRDFQASLIWLESFILSTSCWAEGLLLFLQKTAKAQQNISSIVFPAEWYNYVVFRLGMNWVDICFDYIDVNRSQTTNGKKKVFVNIAIVIAYPFCMTNIWTFWCLNLFSVEVKIMKKTIDLQNHQNSTKT